MGGAFPADRDYIKATRERVVVFDGGMGATLEQFDLPQEDYGGLAGKCHEAFVLNRPDVIQGVHESMLEAGAEVLETDTFQGSRLKLDEWGLAEHTLEINRRAAEIARAAAGEHRFVAGSIGPTGPLPASDDPTLGKIGFRELVEVFSEQARGLVEGGADLIIVETAQDILEVKAAIFGARAAFRETGLPLQGPDGETIFPETPEQISKVLGEFVERFGVSIVGGCCGTTPEHIRAIVDRVGGREAGPRPERGQALVSSMMTATPLVQEPRPTLVGERVNSQGS